MLVRLLAVVMRGGCVLLGLFVIAAGVVMRGRVVMMRRRVMMGSGLKMLLAARMSSLRHDTEPPREHCRGTVSF